MYKATSTPQLNTSKRDIQYIVVHCTATLEDTPIINILNYWKYKLKWRGVGYHYICTKEGTFYQLQDENFNTNGVKGYNDVSIHISYVGGINWKGEPIDSRTTKQKINMREFLRFLRMKYPHAQILGHRDLSPDLNNNGIVEPNEFIKQCPCFSAKIEYKDI